jgi:hypothetical protein
MTSNTTPSGIVSANVDYASLHPYRAFDGTDGYWYNPPQNHSVGYIQYQFPTQKTVKSYNFNTHYNAMCSFTFQASNNGISWIVLGNYINVDTSITSSYTISNNTKYLYYQLNFTADNSGVNSVSSFQMYGY